MLEPFHHICLLCKGRIYFNSTQQSDINFAQFPKELFPVPIKALKQGFYLRVKFRKFFRTLYQISVSVYKKDRRQLADIV